MFRLVCFATLAATALSLTVLEKSFMIWNNIERTPNNVEDGKIYLIELENYFATYYSDVNGNINLYTFDNIWGVKYADDPVTTQYIFATWDNSTRNGLLNADDLAYMFSKIDNPSDLNTAGFLVFASEFEPYINRLYLGCCIPPW